jgi:hypothetical protein
MNRLLAVAGIIAQRITVLSISACQSAIASYLFFADTPITRQAT